jgi:TRAP-type C4-dicarboxylate transport system permease small subunit
MNPFWLFFSLLAAIVGFTFATINVFLNAKYEITKKPFSVGYIGMILSSFPVIFLLVLIIKGH